MLFDFVKSKAGKKGAKEAPKTPKSGKKGKGEKKALDILLSQQEGDATIVSEKKKKNGGSILKPCIYKRR